MADWGRVFRQALRIGSELLSGGKRAGAARPADRRGAGGAAGRPGSGGRAVATAERADRIVYAPDPDGAADPGEIVWAWVPFEEDDGRGKDRPLLVVGRRGAELVGLMLSSQHDRAGDVNWVGIGTGAWDRQGRESFVRLDRVLEIGERDIRREGAVLDRDRFDRVATQLRDRFGWR